MDSIFLKEPINQDSLLRQMLMNSLSFGYYGCFSDQVNDALIPLAENFIEHSGVPLKIRKRAFFIFVECIQNVNRHHYKKNNGKNISKELFLIRQHRERFNIALGNVMNSRETISLKAKIDKLNNLSVDALNTYYKLVLEENILSNRGGAGLGLIEVARKSGNRMICNFEESNPVSTYFSLETNVNEPDSGIDFPRYDGVKDIRHLKKYYADHDMGLLLVHERNYFSEASIEKMVYYLNALGTKIFFTDRNAFANLYIIFQAIGIMDMVAEKDNNNLALHFIRKLNTKHFYICWNSSRSLRDSNILSPVLGSTDAAFDQINISSYKPLYDAIARLRNNISEPLSLIEFVEKNGTFTITVGIPLG